MQVSKPRKGERNSQNVKKYPLHFWPITVNRLSIGNPTLAIVQRFNIQYAINPCPGLLHRSIGTPKAKFKSVYHSEMIEYDTSTITVLKTRASRICNLDPMTVPDVRRMLKMLKAKVSKNIMPTIVLPVAGALSKGTRSFCAKAKGAARQCGQAFARSKAVMLPLWRERNCAVCAIAA